MGFSYHEEPIVNPTLNPEPTRVKRRSRSEWEQLIHAYHLSGLSSKQFCLANNLGYASFCQWRRRLSSESESPDAGLASSFIDMGSLYESQFSGFFSFLANRIEVRQWRGTVFESSCSILNHAFVSGYIRSQRI